MVDQNRKGELWGSGLHFEKSGWVTCLIFQNQTMPAQKSIGLPLLQPPMNPYLLVLLGHFHFFPPWTDGMDGEAEDGGIF